MKIFLILLVMIEIMCADVEEKIIMYAKNTISKCPKYKTLRNEIIAEVERGNQIIIKRNYEICEQRSVYILKISTEEELTPLR